ncbi:protein kinase domain-containing protein [Legionella rowbothamii]|uniref:protein kinase domain-containing protein n=1 Tax=Legionella rowbothamii TaxID=96229 RepID=UPI0013EFA2F7|nr:protein kinase [Legionella rowbothamii]
MLTINPEDISPKYSKELAKFFNTQAADINIWKAGQLYAFENGTQFQFTSDIVKRQRKEGKTGCRYEFISNRLLGTGTFGEVYEIEGTLALSADEVRFKPHGLNNKTRAVKIQRHHVQNPIDAILTEYSLAKEASHLGIKFPTIEGTTSYTVMKKLKGQELFTIITEDFEKISPLTLKQRIELTHSLLKALKEQVTDKGIIHRDVKNENILVDLQSGLVSFFDFGLSVKADALDGKYCGTPAYAPPELFFKGKQTVKIDVFSLGRVLALIWHIDTASYNDPNLSSYSKNSLNVNLDSLFFDLNDIDPNTKRIIHRLLYGMMCALVDSRLTIEQAIVLSTQITLSNQNTQSTNEELSTPDTTALLDKHSTFIQNNLVEIKFKMMQFYLSKNRTDLDTELTQKVNALARDLNSKIDKLSHLAAQGLEQDLSELIREARQLIKENKELFKHYKIGSLLTNISADFRTLVLANSGLNMCSLASSENQFVFFKETKTTPNNSLSEKADESIESTTNKKQ